jgi:hypothetical protein
LEWTSARNSENHHIRKIEGNTFVREDFLITGLGVFPLFNTCAFNDETTQKKDKTWVLPFIRKALACAFVCRTVLACAFVTFDSFSLGRDVSAWAAACSKQSINAACDVNSLVESPSLSELSSSTDSGEPPPPECVLEALEEPCVLSRLLRRDNCEAKNSGEAAKPQR